VTGHDGRQCGGGGRREKPQGDRAALDQCSQGWSSATRNPDGCVAHCRPVPLPFRSGAPRSKSISVRWPMRAGWRAERTTAMRLAKPSGRLGDGVPEGSQRFAPVASAWRATRLLLSFAVDTELVSRLVRLPAGVPARADVGNHDRMSARPGYASRSDIQQGRPVRGALCGRSRRLLVCVPARSASLVSRPRSIARQRAANATAATGRVSSLGGLVVAGPPRNVGQVPAPPWTWPSPVSVGDLRPLGRRRGSRDARPRRATEKYPGAIRVCGSGLGVVG
jgi:hypothetical protein